jgi:hypothetical protein
MALALPSNAVTRKLAGSTVVKLELLQNVTSAYTPPESPIYFRVVDDVLAEGAVVIRKGTLVTGKVTYADSRKRQGVGGTVGLDVRAVPAVDGQLVRVIASTTRVGSSREGAVVGWSLLWGVGALLTHGNNAHIERGAILEAQVLSDRRIDIAAIVDAPPAAPASALSSTVLGHAINGRSTSQLRLNLDKDPVVGSVNFRLQWPEVLASDPLASIELVTVNDLAIPVPTAGTVAKGDEAVFTPWLIAQYCVNGTNALRLRARSQGGATVEFTDTLDVNFTR